MNKHDCRESILRKVLFVVCLVSLQLKSTVVADSSGPRLAAYYDRFLAICGGHVFEWSGSNRPVKLMSGIKQVGVGKNNSYALSNKGELLAWSDNHRKAKRLANQITSFYAGRSGVFAIKDDKSLWHFDSKSLFGFGESIDSKPQKIANHIIYASIGDSANYYVTSANELFVYGLAHRGQYGDGKLTESDSYVHTASGVIQVVSNTGHALLLKQNGTVWGTGGNIFGPLSHHGYGDKAITWGQIFDDVKSIATGSSHTLAIKNDDSLWIWGRREGLVPKQIMTKANTVAAGRRSTISLSQGSLWQWKTGSKPTEIMKCDS